MVGGWGCKGEQWGGVYCLSFLEIIIRWVGGVRGRVGG